MITFWAIGCFGVLKDQAEEGARLRAKARVVAAVGRKGKDVVLCVWDKEQGGNPDTC